jgi:hypothetical protein
VRAGVAAIEAEGFAGVLYAPMGPDVPGELEAMAELLGLEKKDDYGTPGSDWSRSSVSSFLHSATETRHRDF